MAKSDKSSCWPPRNTISAPKLILCEGAADEAFFRALIRTRSGQNFSIRNTSDREPDPGTRGGIDRFGDLLEAVTGFRGFEAVTDILIVADSDDDPRTNFEKVAGQIAGARNPFAGPGTRFAPPAEPLSKSQGSPTVTVLLIPWHDQPGNLECLCLPAAVHAAGGLSKCVDDFADCAGVEQWGRANAEGKMKLRSLLAARHWSNPFIGLGRVWNDAPALIPLDHSGFDRVWDEVARFLS